MGITREQALDCFASDDLIGIGMEADAVRRALHPEGVVSYAVEGTVDLTLPPEKLYERVRHLEAMGVTGLLLQPSLPADCPLSWLTGRLTAVREQWPELWIGGLSATVISALANRTGQQVDQVLSALQAAGLRSLTGDDTEILDDRIRSTSRNPVCSTADWLAVHRAAHRLAIPTSASMTFGQNETMDQRLQHLEAIRALQSETGCFTAFTPVGFQHDISAGGRSLEEATSVEYLKTLAICRMYLDNIRNVQADWQVQGVKVLQMGLRFGGNDVGSVALEKTAGEAASEEDLRRIIRDAGFRPVQRNSGYTVMFLT